MFIGSNPTRTDAERLATFQRLTADAVEQVQALYQDDLTDYGEAVAKALAAARAEGVQSMAQLMWPHENFQMMLEAGFEKIEAASAHDELCALARFVQSEVSHAES